MPHTKITSNSLRSALIVLILFISNTTFAQSWVSVGTPSFTPSAADYGTIAIDTSGTPYIAFTDESDLYKATVMKFNGSDWVTVGTPGFTPGQVAYTSIAIDKNNVPYVAYMDENTVNFRASVMKFADSVWQVVGDTGFSALESFFTCIALDTTGTPYVAYLDDSGCLGLPTVMKFNGTSWVNVGTPRLSSGNVPFVSLAISGSNVPYIAYPDGGDSQKITVMKFADTAWVPVGIRGFTPVSANMVTIAMNKDTPYVAFSDNLDSSGAVVMKYNGTGWVNVGSPDFSAGEADNINISIDRNGTPYVIYEDATAPHLGATVKKFNGSDWVTVGVPGFTTGLDAQNTTIAIDKYGTPYAGFTQFPGGRASVMKFDSSTVVPNTGKTAGITLSIFPNPAKGAFMISASQSTTEMAKVVITNLIGEKVSSFDMLTNTFHQVALNEARGTYFITVTTAHGYEYGKIILSK